jgi:hypothetical protein
MSAVTPRTVQRGCYTTLETKRMLLKCFFPTILFYPMFTTLLLLGLKGFCIGFIKSILIYKKQKIKN